MRGTGEHGGGASRQRPERGSFRFWTEEKLRNADTDQFGHVNNAAMASFFEAGRMELFGNRPDDPEATRLDIVVVRLLMNFHKELYYPGHVAIGSAVIRVGRSSFDLAQALFAGDDCIASAEATCVAIDPASRRPTQISAVLRRYLSGPPTQTGSGARP